MNAALKILAGLIIIAAGFGLFLDSPTVHMWRSVTGINWWNNFVIVLTGVIPPLLLLAGIFIVWLEADELGAEKEMKSGSETEAKEVKSAVESEEHQPEHRSPARRVRRKKKR